jgi:hypothetical protein
MYQEHKINILHYLYILCSFYRLTKIQFVLNFIPIVGTPVRGTKGFYVFPTCRSMLKKNSEKIQTEDSGNRFDFRRV